MNLKSSSAIHDPYGLKYFLANMKESLALPSLGEVITNSKIFPSKILIPK